MNKLLKVVPLVVALIALALSWSQRARLQTLEAQLAASTARQQTQLAADAPPAADTALAARVASLEQTVARVFRMLLSSAQTAKAPAEGDAADDRAVAALREDVDALLTGEAVNTEKGRAQLHQVVRQVQDEIWQERRQRWEAMRDTMRRERVSELAQQANLTPAQTEQLNTMLDEERGQRRALRRAARDGQLDFRQIRAQMETLRQATDAKAKELLDSQQYSAYEQMRQERQGRGRGR